MDSRKKWWWLTAGLVVGTAAVGFAGWYLFSEYQQTNNNKNKRRSIREGESNSLIGETPGEGHGQDSTRTKRNINNITTNNNQINNKRNQAKKGVRLATASSSLSNNATTLINSVGSNSSISSPSSSTSSSPASRYVSEAKECQSRRDYVGARTAWTSAIMLDPLNFRYLTNRANMSLLLDDINGARNDAQLSLHISREKNIDNPGALYAFARAADKGEDYAAALEALEECIAKDPTGQFKTPANQLIKTVKQKINSNNKTATTTNTPGTTIPYPIPSSGNPSKNNSASSTFSSKEEGIRLVPTAGDADSISNGRNESGIGIGIAAPTIWTPHSQPPISFAAVVSGTLTNSNQQNINNHISNKDQHEIISSQENDNNHYIITHPIKDQTEEQRTTVQEAHSASNANVIVGISNSNYSEASMESEVAGEVEEQQQEQQQNNPSYMTPVVKSDPQDIINDYLGNEFDSINQEYTPKSEPEGRKTVIDQTTNEVFLAHLTNRPSQNEQYQLKVDHQQSGELPPVSSSSSIIDSSVSSVGTAWTPHSSPPFSFASIVASAPHSRISTHSSLSPDNHPNRQTQTPSNSSTGEEAISQVQEQNQAQEPPIRTSVQSINLSGSSDGSAYHGDAISSSLSPSTVSSLSPSSPATANLNGIHPPHSPNAAVSNTSNPPSSIVSNSSHHSAINNHNGVTNHSPSLHSSHTSNYNSNRKSNSRNTSPRINSYQNDSAGGILNRVNNEDFPSLSSASATATATATTTTTTTANSQPFSLSLTSNNINAPTNNNGNNNSSNSNHTVKKWAAVVKK